MNVLYTLFLTLAAAQIGLIVNPDASYAVTMGGVVVPQLASATNGAYVLRYDGIVHSSNNGTLTADAPPAPLSGADVLGDFTGYRVSFNGGVFVATFRVYAARNAIVFAQAFPGGLSGMSGGDPGGLSSAFPVFGPTKKDLNYPSIGYLTWSGCMCSGKTGVWTDAGLNPGHFSEQSGPIVIFNETASFALSPANSFMTANLNFCALTGMALGSGLGGMVNEVPPGWTYETIVVGGVGGVTNTVVAWGDALLLRGNKTRTKPDADIAVATLGYWTDNWKECSGSTNSWLVCKGAVELWEPRDDVFPDGFNFKPDGLPLVLHNRWFSGNNNSYITKLGFKDSFIVEARHDFALPIKADVFKYLMGRAQAWGMQVYEQDWLITVWNTMDVTKFNVTAGSSWLAAMAEAASELGVTIQYCMPLPRHMLESTFHQPVTNARSSGDYHPDNDDYDIGLSSLFYWAIGVAPSKDDYWTSEFQPGSPYGDKPTEPNWMLEAITVALSTGPNGPSDGLGFSNASVILATVRSDGFTLQPDRPATIVDAALLASITEGALPNVRSTSTTYHDYKAPISYAWHYVLSVDLQKDFSMPVAGLGPAGAATQYAVFDFFAPGAPRAVAPAGGAFTVPAGQGQPSAPTNAKAIQFLALVPQLPGGWWLLGEKGKYVKMSKQRVTAMTFLSDGFSAAVTTAPGEAVVFLVAPASGTVAEVRCTNAASPATLTCTAGACTCA